MSDQVEYRILRGSLSWFLLELVLLRETVESAEGQIASDLDAIGRELSELEPLLDEQWAAEDVADIQQEVVEPTALETRYAELDEAKWSRQQHAKIVRAALFLATYAAFEQCLDGLADQWREERGLTLKPSDLRDRGIERSKAYLTKVVGMPFPSESSEWESICHLRTIRNQLAHEGPRLANPPGSQLRAAIQAFPGIYSEEDQGLSISREFLEDALGTLGAFGDRLVKEHTEFSEQKPKLLE